MQRVIERAWYGTGQMCQRTISAGEFAAQILISRQKGETSYRWTGKDITKERLHVAWIVNPAGTATMIAYELPLGGGRS